MPATVVELVYGEIAVKLNWPSNAVDFTADTFMKIMVPRTDDPIAFQPIPGNVYNKISVAINSGKRRFVLEKTSEGKFKYKD